MSDEIRQQMAEVAKGKVVESLEYETEDEESGPYWVMAFTDGSEIAFRLMNEV